MIGTVSLTGLRLTRGHIKGSMTKLATYTESINEMVSLVELEVKLHKADELWNEFNSSQSLMYEFSEKDGYVDPVPDYEEFEAKYLMVKSVLLSAIRERKHSSTNKDPVHLLAEQQQALINSLNKSNAPSGNADTFLPTIRIEPFSGNYREWLPFRDMFESAVHNKPGLSPIQKFHFLKSCLRNEALNLLSHLPLSDATYEQAWARLEKRYDKPRYVINSYIKTFMELPSTHRLNVGLLRKISDGADEVVRGLNSLNSINRDPWLIYVLTNKLDPDTRQAWSEESVSEDYPTIEQLINFLERRCEALESARPNTREIAGVRQPLKSMHVSSSQICLKCKGDHGLPQCPQFLSMDVQARRDFVKTSKLCFICLRRGHSSAQCRSKFRCTTCNTHHHSLVHDNSVSIRSQKTEVNESSRNSQPAFTRNYSLNLPSTSATVDHVLSNHSHSILNFHKLPQTLLPTAIGKVLDVNGIYQPVRILIDSGSQVSFITESCTQRLGLRRINARIPINGIGSTNAGTSRGLTSMVIRSRCDSFRITVDTYILSSVTTSLPTNSFTIEDWKHLHQLDLADPSFNQSNPVDILLGADKAWEILLGKVEYSDQGHPIAQKTIFGWVLAGRLLSKSEPNLISHHTTLDIDSILQSFWTIEEVNHKTTLSDDDIRIEEHFLNTHRRASDGRYIVDLPFKSPPIFANTLAGAISRLRAMERKFSRDPNLRDNYSRFLDEYLRLGHMSTIPSGEIGNTNVFYLPHHCVQKPDSKTTKLRVVFDGSYKDVNGNCLNDSLIIGPPIQRNLFSVSLRFRRFRFVFTADIVKMFRQILVSDKDSDFQRIVWRKSPLAPLQHFRLRTVTYGTSCAPYLSVRTLEQLAKDYKDEFPIASEVVLNDFYVDDVASGADSLADAISKRDSLLELLSKCGMELSKWQSNCVELLPDGIPQTRENILMDNDADSWVKVLGLSWNSKRDVYSFRLNYTPNETITKRQILKDVARIFDPLGFLSPSVVQLKILFQELWYRKLSWDENVPYAIATQWSKYRDEIKLLTTIEVPRTIGLGNPSFELHGFSDASATAYAAVIYSRYQLPNGTYQTNIVAAKSRVAPIKQLSIPRLELCAAVLLARLLVAVQSSLSITFANVYAWSDSKVVLSWLSSSPRRWNVFVGNRTSEILNTIPRNRWFHVRSQCNPADCASRGIPPSQLIEHPLWWTGPYWLRHCTEDWPIINKPEEDPAFMEEEKKIPQQIHLATNDEHPYEQLSMRISSWTTFIGAVARLHRFISRCQRKSQSSSHYLKTEEIYEAKTRVIRWLQDQYFGDYLNHCRKHDRDNILRVGGRIHEADLPFNTKHPIIIPKEHIITKLIIQDAHIRFLPPGVSTLFALIRQEYWILGCRNLLRKITHDCIRCFRQRKTTITQLMGNLPQQRVTADRPFSRCGCDYAGPIVLKHKLGRKSVSTKGYICLFVCLTIKAIHLELVSDLTTEAFLAAFRRFVARRGKPSHVYSDNGTNFRGCARLISAMHELVLSQHHNSLVSESLARDGISWHFIPPLAPHFGGLWEAGVKSVKQNLRRVIGNDVLTFEQYYTLLTQIEAILNSRPLCQISDSELNPLAPAHFLTGESYAAIPEPSIDAPESRLNHWNVLQSKLQGYWKRWQSEYVTSLQQRPRWQQTNLTSRSMTLWS